MIGDALPAIPDVVAPIRAVRCWQLRNDLLHSVNGTMWLPRQTLTAVCLPSHAGWHYMAELDDYDVHEAPGPVAAHNFYGETPLPVCGIYGFKTLEHGLKQEGYRRYVWGEVDLWGRVYPYSEGYRAQFAKPAVLYRHAELDVSKAAEKYGVTVVDRPDLPPPVPPCPDLVALAGECLDTVARHVLVVARTAWRNRRG